MRAVFTGLLVWAALSTLASSGEPLPSLEQQAAWLADPDPAVRLPVERAWILRGEAAHAASAGRVARGIAVAKRIAGRPEGSVARWMRIEEAFGSDVEGLSSAILERAMGRDAAASAVVDREVARVVVGRFCREWDYATQHPEPDPMVERLRRAGRACAPPLLRIIGADLVRSFSGDGDDGVDVQMQIRAMHGVGFLGIAEAVPYLVLHGRNMSAWAEGAALIQLEKVAKDAPRWQGHHEGTVEALRAWIAPRRTAYAESLGWLGSQVFPAQRTALVRKALGLAPDRLDFAAPTPMDATSAFLERLAWLSGEALDCPPTLPLDERLRVLREIEARWKAKFPS